MADDTSPALPMARSMSLVPYIQDSRQIVLRRGNAIVEYDTDSRQLTVRDASDPPVELSTCPYCHQPFPTRRGTTEDEPSHQATDVDRPFMRPDYFAMLAASQRPSPSSSGFATPSRRFIPHTLRSGRSRDVSGVFVPADAEDQPSEPSGSSEQGFSSSALNPGFFRQNFKELRELGRGGNGVVLLVEHFIQSTSLGLFACKRIPVGNSTQHFEKLIVEVRLLQTILPHSNIVTPHFVWLEDHQSSTFGPSVPYLWILLDYCNGGDLHSHVLGPVAPPTTSERLKEKLRSSRRAKDGAGTTRNGHSKLTFEEIFSFFHDITTGLHHLHSRGYIHRDLKPSNCLLHHEGERTRVLISDFGEIQSVEAIRGSTGATGTISFCAPEVLQQAPDGSFGPFTVSSDIFSLGMIVYFMCFGRLPYNNADGVNEEEEDLDALRAEIMKWQGINNDETRIRPDLPEQLYKYLKRLLSVDPRERPTTTDILASIRAGVGFGDSDWAYEESKPRVSLVDSPGPKQPKTSKTRLRSGLSLMKRTNSSDNTRSRSPPNPDQTRSSELTKSRDISMALDSRKADRTTSPTGALHSPLQSPRLMLPPPPEAPATRALVRITQNTTVVLGVRVLLFLGKLISLSTPCTPYAPRQWILYSLLGLAALDLGLLKFGVRRSLLLLGVHLATVILAQNHGQLCEAGKLFTRDTD